MWEVPERLTQCGHDTDGGLQTRGPGPQCRGPWAARYGCPRLIQAALKPPDRYGRGVFCALRYHGWTRLSRALGTLFGTLFGALAHVSRSQSTLRGTGLCGRALLLLAT